MVVAKAAVEGEVVAVIYDLTQVLWEVHQEEEVEVAAVSLVLLQRQQA